MVFARTASSDYVWPLNSVILRLKNSLISMSAALGDIFREVLRLSLSIINDLVVFKCSFSLFTSFDWT